jgi:hypothetical protein
MHRICIHESTWPHWLSSQIVFARRFDVLSYEDPHLDLPLPRRERVGVRGSSVCPVYSVYSVRGEGLYGHCEERCNEAIALFCRDCRVGLEGLLAMTYGQPCSGIRNLLPLSFHKTQTTSHFFAALGLFQRVVIRRLRPGPIRLDN